MSSIRIGLRPSDTSALLCRHLKNCRFATRSIADIQILTFSRFYARIGRELTAVFTVNPDREDTNVSILHLSITGMTPDTCATLVRHICAGEIATAAKFDFGASYEMLGTLMKSLTEYRI